MSLISLVPLTEAATFTLGCVLLQAGRLDQDRVSVALGLTIALLFAGLLLALTPDSIDIDPNALDPDGAWPVQLEELGQGSADLRQQLASAQDMLVETAIDAGNMHALVEAMRTERDAWRDEALTVRATPEAYFQTVPRQMRPAGLAG